MKNYLLILAVAACPVYAAPAKPVDPTDKAALQKVVNSLPKKAIRHEPQLARQVKADPYPWVAAEKGQKGAKK